MELISPKYSFVFFDDEEHVASYCNECPDFCIPVIEAGDINFQFNAEADDIADADAIFDTPIENTRLIIATTAGVTIRDWTTTDGLLFEKFRTGPTTVTFVWKNDFFAFKDLISCDQCFMLRLFTGFIIGGEQEDIETDMNCFIRKCDPCYTTVIEYSNEEDGFSFNYCNTDLFKNRVRLPFYFSQPQFADDESVYTKSDGTIKMLRSVTKKEYLAQTEFFDEIIHEKLKVALSHDSTELLTGNYIGQFRKNGNYEIEWEGTLCSATAKFKALVTPYAVRNNNCSECEPYSGVEEPPPVCPIPHDIEISLINQENFLLSFLLDVGATDWEFSVHNNVGAVIGQTNNVGAYIGNTPCSGVVTFDSPAPAGNYEVRVRTICAGSTSAYVVTPFVIP